MQNVSRIQRHPDTLIKNFFIAGLSQRTLKDDIFPKGNENEKRDLFNLTPEMLFSLYEEPEKMAMYLGQVFPDKVSIFRGEKLIDPKFFSFMSVDMQGFNQYNHCLIFYERFSADLIREDFDQGKYIEKLLAMRRREENGEEENERFGQAGINEKAAEKMTKVADKLIQQYQKAHAEREVNKPDASLELRKELSRGNMGMRVNARGMQGEQAKKMRVTENTKTKAIIIPNGMPSLMKKSNSNNQPTSLDQVDEKDEEDFPNSLQTSIDLDTPQFGMTRAELNPEGGNSSVLYHKESLIVPQKDVFGQARASGQTVDSFMTDPSTGPRTDHTQIGPIKVDSPQVSKFTRGTNEDSERITLGTLPIRDHSSGQVNSRPTDPDYYFAPIAFVIQTEVEHHDIFKEILLTLFESIRVPEEVTDNEQDNLDLAYAEFVAHLAFLISIPCPTFNTRYHVEFFDKTLTLTEPNFDEIPDKNQLAIRVLFEMLDVRTIMYCWKSILFDKTLVLISSQFSLQFYIAQALLQLVFPLTFQYSYVQPCNKARIGMVKSPFPILICCSSLVETFENFEGLSKEQIAICDIDGSFTNNLELPELEDENTMLRSLSALKNFKGARYDSAFKEMYEEDMRIQDESFTIQARNVFFGILNQFLDLLCDGACFIHVADAQERVFINYFDEEAYLQWFEGTKNYNFAKTLMSSQLFASFCDDWFDKTEVSNMLVYMNISRTGFDMDEADNCDPTMKLKFEERMSDITQKLIQTTMEPKDLIMNRLLTERLERGQSEATQERKTDGRSTKSKPIDPEAIYQWPKTKKMDFCWRLPVDSQRVMIYEKLAYAIEAIEEHRSFSEKYSDHFDDKTELEMETCESNHRQQVDQVYRKIKHLKKLYANKLPVYREQLEKAKKSPLLWSSKNARTAEGQIDPLKAFTTKLNQEESKGGKPQHLAIQKGGSSRNLTAQKKNEYDAMVDKTNQSKVVFQSQNNALGGFGEELKRINTDDEFSQGINVGALDEFCTLDDLQVIKNPSQGDEPIDVTPKAKQKRFQQQPSMMQHTADYDGFSQADTEYQKTKLQEKRRRNKDRFCKNRIVELVYGQDGLIEFLDLLFTQFPRRSQVKAKFNYYFAIRKQLQAIENQIQDSLEENTDKPNFMEWHKKHYHLLTRSIPQRNAQILPASQEANELSSQLQSLKMEKVSSQKSSDSDFFSTPKQKRIQSIFPGGVASMMSPALKRSSTSILIKGINGVQVQNSTDCGEEPKRKNIFEMQAAHQNPLTIKAGKLNVFEQSNIGSEKWMLPVLPDEIELDERTKCQEYFNDMQKLIAFRTSYQYISLKQKLFFAFEDQDEAVSLIFGELLLFQQRDRQIFPTSRFYELLGMMSDEQKKRIFTQIVAVDIGDSPTFFQLRLMFEHEINGMNADKDEPVSLDSQLFCQDFLNPPAKSAAQKLAANYSQLKQKSQLETVKEIQKKGELLDIIGKGINKMKDQVKNGTHAINASMARMTDPDQMERDSIVSVYAVTQSTVTDSTVKTGLKHSFNKERFTSQYSKQVKKKLLPNPEMQVAKLIETLLKIYISFFDRNNFNEEKQEMTNKELIPTLIQKMKALREVEVEKLGSREIIFTQALDSQASKKEQDDIKRCFWINLFNFKVLQKTLEILLTKPRLLKKELHGPTMSVSLMSSIKVLVQGEELTCYEIFKTMMRHDDIHLMNGPFEDEVRTLADMPEPLRKLAVNEQHPMTSFALYMPLKKWHAFNVFEKESMDDQLRELIFSTHDRLQLNPENFLQRIPKFFFWNQPQEECAVSQRTQDVHIRTHSTDALRILQKMIDMNALRGPQLEAVRKVLSHIKHEQANEKGGESGHLFEIDNLCWRFDILSLRANLRNYCVKKRLWVPQSQVNSVMTSQESPFKGIQKYQPDPEALRDALTKAAIRKEKDI